MTQAYILIFSFLVSSANIALNFLSARTASSVSEWQSMFSTATFGFAFLVGTASLLLLLTLYFFGRNDQFGMANGVLLMGATSIVGGTLFGYFLGGRVHWSEWCLFVLILTFVVIRFVLAITIPPTNG
ncbi:hypothetical protein [Bradyrhizobium sp. SZCCHNRI20481]|uniref:hypothetical protein n=1 Tax=Bradyrhizobium sp. SZCCHNRI20481 TaxID=3057286 RepID=UPI002916A86E|nr:hypothetical protein [Bradyrhizobium sp. SZCCHNRI20481]